MRITKSISVIFSMLFALSVWAGAQEKAEDSPRSIDVDLYLRQDGWIMAPTVADGPSGDVTKSVYVSVVRFVDPHTGFPYEDSEPSLGFDINDLSHSFRLEKKDFILGEPILIEHRIELNGPGELTWFVGGNYRSRGRDDNFNFVLRRDDGVIVPDVYPRFDGGFGGGLGSDHTIKNGQPFSYWSALQRYSAITEPGVYDLYCMTGNKQITPGRVEALKRALPEGIALDHYVDDSGFLIDRETGQRSKRYELVSHEHYLDSGKEWPLADMLPAEVLRFLSEQSGGFSLAPPPRFGTIAHFKITIRTGTTTERQEMTARWTRAAQSKPDVAAMGRYRTALLESFWYMKQDYFLPLLEEWIATAGDREEWSSSVPLYLDGLAMRSDSAAFRLLLKAAPKRIVGAFYRLHHDRISDAVPLCIEWLTHGNNEVRAMAESSLVRWTGQSFEHTWNGYHYQRPTLEEGKRMQTLWREWWKKNSRSFKPQAPCNWPCITREKTGK